MAVGMTRALDRIPEEQNLHSTDDDVGFEVGIL